MKSEKEYTKTYGSSMILGDAIYTDKNGSSYLDPLYATNVSTDHLKELARKVKERRAAHSGKENE